VLDYRLRMRTLLLAVLVAAAAIGCSKNDKAPAAESSDKISSVSVDELDQALQKGDCQAVDANGEGTRKKMGVIPNAILLTDSDTFTARELPADKQKPLVFYCANTHCGASHEAAGKALTAGYVNVKVLPAGIAGWVEAGKKIQKI
jgi:rhodanese-related sulfurtransferase